MGTGDAASLAASLDRVARHATYALFTFTALLVVTLLAYFFRADQPWGFESFIALLSALLGIGATTLFWRTPSRQHALGGIAVFILSLLRVGLPADWGIASVVVLTVTALLLIPLVHAAIVLPRS